MNLRSRTTLLCGALALAIAASILLRGRKRRVDHIFAMFAADLGLLYLGQSLYGLFQAALWERVTALLAILLPQFALHLFEAIVPQSPKSRSALLRVAGVLAMPVFVLTLTPQHDTALVRGGVFIYIFGLLAVGLWSLARRGQRSPSRATQQRVRFLVGVGALAATFSTVDFLWFIGAEPPPVGAVLSVVFVFALAESLRRERLLDIYELVGRLLVSTALAFALAGIFYVFVTFGRFHTMYLNAVLAAIVILVLFEPLRAKVEQQIHAVFFRERYDLEAAIGEARRKLVYLLELDDLRRVVLEALEESRRVTAGALYLSDATGEAFDLAVSLGEDIPKRVEIATARAILDRLGQGTVLLEEVGREVAERRESLDTTIAEDEAALAAAEVLGPLREGVVIGIRDGKGSLAGLLVVTDDRVHDAFSPDEVALLESLAAQIGVVVENSLVYKRMQERDRLAALGQMAAGLAHEIKNPLGAIKGAAQLLADPAPESDELDEASREFVGIILEEVDRLDRVVGSVLDYARPSGGNPAPVDPNGIVHRTVQILSSDRDGVETEIVLDLADDLPRVRVDVEQLRQVIMNLIRNAIQAMNGGGRVIVSTRIRAGARVRSGDAPSWVEVSVEDSGPGISQKVLANLFVPFFTTKNHGTGLGLAISQRIVRNAGGSIEVHSHEGAGTTFTILLPASRETIVTPAPSEVATEGRDERISRDSLLGYSQ